MYDYFISVLDKQTMSSTEISPAASAEQSREPSPMPNITLDGDEEHTCRICEEKLKQPKILNCLHVFCLTCLENENEDAKDLLTCSICKQNTKVPAGGIAALQPEYVISDLLEMAAIEDKQILCNSCKAKEKAVARCRDCISGNYLCGNCVTAHQFMRCFDNHEVRKMEKCACSCMNYLFICWLVCIEYNYFTFLKNCLCRLSFSRIWKKLGAVWLTKSYFVPTILQNI